jgi:hypothetical protein
MATADLLARDAIALAGDSPRAILGNRRHPGSREIDSRRPACHSHPRRQGRLLGRARSDGRGFHLADAQLDRIGAGGRKGAPDTFDGAGYAHVLLRLKQELDDPV